MATSSEIEAALVERTNAILAERPECFSASVDACDCCRALIQALGELLAEEESQLQLQNYIFAGEVHIRRV
mgnify:CR=1 FL=1